MRGYSFDSHLDSDQEPIDVPDVTCVGATSLALHVRLANGRERWVPRSTLHDSSELQQEGDEGVLSVHAWWAEEVEIEALAAMGPEQSAKLPDELEEMLAGMA